jgi:hypothetical protein
MIAPSRNRPPARPSTQKPAGPRAADAGRCGRAQTGAPLRHEARYVVAARSVRSQEARPLPTPPPPPAFPLQAQVVGPRSRAGWRSRRRRGSRRCGRGARATRRASASLTRRCSPRSCGKGGRGRSCRSRGTSGLDRSAGAAAAWRFPLSLSLCSLSLCSLALSLLALFQSLARDNATYHTARPLRAPLRARST